MTELAPWSAARLVALETLRDAELAEAKRLTKKARSDQTWDLYERDGNLFAAWCVDREVSPLPADVTTVVRYIASEHNRLAPSTLRRRVASISVIHQVHGYESPTRDPAVLDALSGAAREHAAPQRKVKAVRTSVLRTLVEPLDPAVLADLRDRAILTIGWTGALRRSEVVAIDVEHITEDPEGLKLFIPRSKRDQEGKGALTGLPYLSRSETCPVRSWRAWLSASGITSGPAFRAIDKHGHLSANRLTDRQVARIVQRRATAVGLPGSQFGGHSLRAGFATEAHSKGRSELSIMRQGRWKSRSSMHGYVEEGGLWVDNPAVGLDT